MKFISQILKSKNCDVTFKNVSFKYETTEEKAINNVNLQIEGNKVTALVGKVVLEKVQ